MLAVSASTAFASRPRAPRPRAPAPGRSSSSTSCSARAASASSRMAATTSGGVESSSAIARPTPRASERASAMRQAQVAGQLASCSARGSPAPRGGRARSGRRRPPSASVVLELRRAAGAAAPTAVDGARRPRRRRGARAASAIRSSTSARLSITGPCRRAHQPHRIDRQQQRPDQRAPTAAPTSASSARVKSKPRRAAAAWPPARPTRPPVTRAAARRLRASRRAWRAPDHADLPRAGADRGDEQVGDRDADRRRRCASSTARRRRSPTVSPSVIDGGDRREERLRVPDQLRGDEPGERRGHRGLQDRPRRGEDRSRRVAQPHPGGLGGLLEQLGARRMRRGTPASRRGSLPAHRRYQRGDTFGGGPSAARATSTVGSRSAMWPFSAIAKCSPRPSTRSARTPNEAAIATKSGFDEVHPLARVAVQVLVEADHPVAAVVHDHGRQRDVLLPRRGQLAARVQEAAVARDAHRRARARPAPRRGPAGRRSRACPSRAGRRACAAPGSRWKPPSQ